MVEHDCCDLCKHENLKGYQEPCVRCKYTMIPSSDEYSTAPDLYEPIGGDTPKDLVHHPAHYCYSQYEPKDVIRSWGLNFNLGSAVKYIARAEPTASPSGHSCVNTTISWAFSISSLLYS